MSFQSPYIYIVKIEGQPDAFFTWPNPAKRYIKDIYTGRDGELHLPPGDRIAVKRSKVNPHAGHTIITDTLNIQSFLGIKPAG